MDFRILGPLEVLENGRALDLGGAKQRAVVALLALHANRVVAREQLIDALWDEEPPETARKALQVYVSQLRKLLGRERLETKGRGYLLRLEPDELDLAASSASATAASRRRRSLWRGDPLADFADQRFAQAEISGCKSSASRASSSESSATSPKADTPSWSASSRPRRRAPAPRAPPGSADAGPLPLRPASRGARGLSGRPQHPRRRARHRARAQAPRAPPADPQPGSGSRPARPEAAGTRRATGQAFTRAHSGADRRGAEDGHGALLRPRGLDRARRAPRPESLRGLLGRWYEAMREPIERHGGTVEKFIGDAVMAVFGVPQVHEDDALRAVRAAVEMRAGLDRLNAELVAEQRPELQIRIGINSGEVVTGDGSATLVTGDAVNTAKRLEEAAGADEILIGARDAPARRECRPSSSRPSPSPQRESASRSRPGGCSGRSPARRRSRAGSTRRSSAHERARVPARRARRGHRRRRMPARHGLRRRRDRQVAAHERVRRAGPRRSGGPHRALPAVRRRHHVPAAQRARTVGRRRGGDHRRRSRLSPTARW